MYPKEPGIRVSNKTGLELDDELFSSDPASYFYARIAALLSKTEVAADDELTQEVAKLVGPSASMFTTVDPRVAEAQRAVDAFALRHQVAEALLRFLYAVAHTESCDEESVWVRLCDSPVASTDVIRQAQAALDDDPLKATEQLEFLLVPADGFSGTEEELAECRSIHVAWINFAIELLRGNTPDRNAANNKMKHGMAVVPQDDVLMTLTVTPPNGDGTIHVDALNAPQALNFLEGNTMQFLSRQTRRGSLHLTQMRMDTAGTLAEATALTTTYALLFFYAGKRHFAERELPRGRSGPKPPAAFLGGPLPRTVRPDVPYAIRFPLTAPDPALDESAQWFWYDGTTQNIAFGDTRRGRVIGRHEQREDNCDG